MRNFVISSTLAILTCVLSGSLYAQPSEEWSNSATVYLWLPSISGELKFGPPDSGGTVDAAKILDSLEVAFMGAFEVSRGDLSFIADIIYLDLGADKTGNFVTLPGGVDTSTSAELGISGWQLGFYGAHTVKETARLQLSGVAGVRYLDLDVDAQVDVTGIQGERSRDFERAAEVWDAVLGVRGRFDLNENWFVPFHADIGTGESDITWQFLTGVGYRFESLDAQLMYRHLEWDEGDEGLIQNLSFSGPAVALRWRF